MADATIKNIPQNRALGTLAEWLMSAKNNTGTIGEFLLGQAPETLANMSYGFYPTQGTGQTFGLKPESLDVAGLIPTGLLGGLAAKTYANLAGKELARNIAQQTTFGQMIDPRMMAIEAKGKEILNLPTDPTFYTAKSLGSGGQEVYYKDKLVGTTQGKLKNAPNDFVKELKSRIDNYKLKSETQTKASNVKKLDKLSNEMLKKAFNENKELISSIHANKELKFNPIENEYFDKGVHVYQSPNYGKKLGSSYRIIDVNGEPAYARQSDHWGKFYTNKYDEYGDLVSDIYNWELPTASNNNQFSGDRLTGYILLKDLKNK